jgi:hypothetical protein
VPPVATRTTSMSSFRVKFVAMPGMLQTGRWITANWQRSRSTLFGLSRVVAVGYLSATFARRISSTASS